MATTAENALREDRRAMKRNEKEGFTYKPEDRDIRRVKLLGPISNA